MTETTPEDWHGQIRGYYSRGCRCADCREAARVYYHEVVKKDPPKPCQVEDCPKNAAPRNRYCHAHKGRLRRTGSLGGGETRTMMSADAGYEAAHKRAVRAKGKASEYVCVRCNERDAKDWAYIHGSPNEKPAGIRGDGTLHGPYSLDPDDYEPMCAPCHKDYDLERAGKAATRCLSCGQRVNTAS